MGGLRERGPRGVKASFCGFADKGPFHLKDCRTPNPHFERYEVRVCPRTRADVEKFIREYNKRNGDVADTSEDKYHWFKLAGHGDCERWFLQPKPAARPRASSQPPTRRARKRVPRAARSRSQSSSRGRRSRKP